MYFRVNLGVTLRARNPEDAVCMLYQILENGLIDTVK